MSKTVKVTYNSETLMTEITVDGQSFDTSRINGKEIADWAYPFMMRKIKWNGFYDEMVEALGGEKSFDLIFDGSEDDLNELKEAWEDAPVNIISEACSGNNVVIEYDEDTLSTNITVNGVPFDTSRINGKEIDDWVYPFMMRKVKWGGIFGELANVTGSEEYTIEFSGSNSAMKVLMEECPEDVEIMRRKNTHNKKTANKKSCATKSQNGLSEKHNEHKEKAKVKFCAKYGNKWNDNGKHLTGEENAQNFYVRGLWYRDIIKNYRKAERLFRLSYALDVSLGNPNPRAENDMDLSDDSKYELANTFYYGSICCSPNYYKALEYYKQIEDSLNECGKSHMAYCYEKIADGLYWEENYTLSINKYLESIRLLECVINYYSDEINNNEDYDDVEYYTFRLNYVNDDIGRCYYRIAQCYSNIEDYKKSVEWYTKAAEQDHLDAQYMLGCCYYYGRGVEQNYEKAVKWYTKAAEQDLVNAQYRLGDCYYFGEGVSRNYEKAVEWYTKAAENFYPPAQNALGNCYDSGRGVKQNYEKAVEWYTKAAEHGNKYAQNALGDCYYLGRGVEEDCEKAVEWYTEAAEQDNVDAQYMLGVCYYLGEGVEKNYQEAVRLFTAASDEGHVDSLDFLGDCYYNGNGVAQNYSKAVSLYEKALSEGSSQAYYNLGSCYRWGFGVNKNKEKAKELFKKGIELDNNNCKEAYEDMLKNNDRIEKAKKIGGGILSALGNIGSAYAQNYVQSALNDDYDDGDYYDDYDE